MTSDPPLVLLVDDEDDVLVTTALLLEDEGFRVATASGGHEALDLVRGGLVPDVVLLDQRMPGLTGTETLAALRGAGLRARSVLVSAMRDVEATGAEHGFDGALRKPFEVHALTALIRRLLEPGGPRTTDPDR